MHEDQRQVVIKKAGALGIKISDSAPESFTSSVNANRSFLVAKVTTETQLEEFIKLIAEINKEKADAPPVSVTVIGGGRSGNNNSYSIGNLWEGTDVYIQLAWDPKIKIIPDNENVDAYTCEISPNIMLIELNKQLYEAGYHCPTLLGCLPFMSFAGGLSTKSHTAHGFLADIVEQVELLLPNGEKKVINKSSDEFKLICEQPTLGLLGTITSISISVKKDSKKLQRDVAVLTFADLLRQPQTAYPENTAIMFSSVGLTEDTPVKITKWKWVAGEEKDLGKHVPQVTNSSIIATRLVPWLANNHPKILATVFEAATMSMSQERTTIRPADAIMGPEAILSGAITEMGLFFNYDRKNLEIFYSRLLKLLEAKRAQNEFPVNTAIFMRFPKSSNGNKIAIDFVSFGLNLPALKIFVTEVIGFLKAEGITPSLHYGKSYGIAMNQSGETDKLNWDNLKKDYQAFYDANELDSSVLNRRIAALENSANQAAKAEQSETTSDKYVWDHYLKTCQSNKARLEKEIDKFLKKYEDHVFLKLSNIEKATKTFNKYDDLLDKIVDYNGNLDINKVPDKDKKFFKTLKKYKIVKELEQCLDAKTVQTDNNNQASVINYGGYIEAFHKKIDHERNVLISQRDSSILKWFGVFAASLAGLGIFSYWSGSTAYKGLFNTTTSRELLQPVEHIRKQWYQNKANK